MDIQFIFALFLFTSAAHASLEISGNEYDQCGMVKGNSTGKKQKEFTFEIIGTDYENIPVILMNWGKWDYGWLVENPEELNVYQRNYDHIIDELSSGLLSKRFPLQNWTGDSLIAIIDFEGFNYRQSFDRKISKFVLKWFTKLQQMAGQLAYGFAINANPFVDQLLTLAKPTAGSYLEKIEIHGTNSKKWLPQILRKIPRDQLPPSLGGHEDFKPIAKCHFL